MVNENIIPKTETIYELKEEYKIPSFEEFMKTYKSNEETDILAEAEYQDQALNGPRYGPGNTQSTGERVKTAFSGVLAVSYFIPPLAPVGIAVSVGVGVTGAAMAKLSDDPEVKRVGQDMLEVVAGAVEHKDMAGEGVKLAGQYNQLRK